MAQDSPDDLSGLMNIDCSKVHLLYRSVSLSAVLPRARTTLSTDPYMLASLTTESPRTILVNIGESHYDLTVSHILEGLYSPANALQDAPIRKLILPTLRIGLTVVFEVGT